MTNKKELEELLLERDCIKRVSVMTREQLDDTFGHEFGILKNYNQHNPHHHLDLLSHTLITLSVVQSFKFAPEDKLCLALAALMHDIGKPTVAKCKGDRMVYYDHPIAGRQIADKLLHAYGFPENTIHRVLFFIGYHDAFINFKFSHEIDANRNPYMKSITLSSVAERLHHIQIESENKYRYLPTANDFQLLMKLCTADVYAQADTVYQNGMVIDTRRNKIARIQKIGEIIVHVVNDQN